MSSNPQFLYLYIDLYTPRLQLFDCTFALLRTRVSGD